MITVFLLLIYYYIYYDNNKPLCLCTAHYSITHNCTCYYMDPQINTITACSTFPGQNIQHTGWSIQYKLAKNITITKVTYTLNHLGIQNNLTLLQSSLFGTLWNTQRLDMKGGLMRPNTI